MAQITLEKIRHSYEATPTAQSEWALKHVDIEWADGGAYALLGPSGCGKSTLLNIISGLVKPTEGRILFDGADVTDFDPTARHVAQVFQFPVVYDTMSVYANLAFPLRNRQIPEADVKQRVEEVAAMLDLDSTLDQRAANLSADGKQKISLGRGLVRPDVNVIMFDEPLTVIDPHLKWLLRSKLKEVHRRFGNTMIYVTHDQTEALTFADKVVVMLEGEVVQIGTPVELFERPQHTFVGHFIGSPGMNVMPCQIDESQVIFDTEALPIRIDSNNLNKATKLELGIRPEFINFSPEGIAVSIDKVVDLGRLKIVNLRRGEYSLKMLLPENAEIPSENPCVSFEPGRAHVYADDWLIERGQSS